MDKGDFSSYGHSLEQENRWTSWTTRALKLQNRRLMSFQILNIQKQQQHSQQQQPYTIRTTHHRKWQHRVISTIVSATGNSLLSTLYFPFVCCLLFLPVFIFFEVCFLFWSCVVLKRKDHGLCFRRKVRERWRYLKCCCLCKYEAREKDSYLFFYFFC